MPPPQQQPAYALVRGAPPVTVKPWPGGCARAYAWSPCALFSSLERAKRAGGAAFPGGGWSVVRYEIDAPAAAAAVYQRFEEQ